MIDKRTIAMRVTIIEQCMQVLEKIRKKGLAHYEADLESRLMAERALHIVIESTVDISNHIIAVRGWRRPRDYADVFRILGEMRVIDEDLTNRLMKMARFRHRLVHVYSSIDNRLVFSFIENDLKDILEFVKIVVSID